MKKITIYLFTIAALGSGCKKFTENINNNPNQPTAVTPNVLLSAALTSSASNQGGDFDNLNTWMGYWSRSGSYIADVQTETYAIGNGYADGEWQSLYTTLSYYNNVEVAGDASPKTLAFYIGVAKTMKAFHFGELVDGFNDVPYSQTFNINKYPTPTYDKAQTIYTSIIAQLDSAVTYFQTASAGYAQGSTKQSSIDNQYDLVFGRGGTTSGVTRATEWIELANTIKLKLLMNESLVAPSSTISSEIAKAVASGGFLPAGTSAGVNPGYSTAEQAQMNPFYGSFYTTGGSPQQNLNYFRANKWSTYFLSGTGDTYRNQLFYSVLVAPDSIGANYEGDPNSVSNALTSTVGTGLLKSPSQDQEIMPDFESLFLQAQAVQLGYNVGAGLTAAGLTQSAIEQNFIYLGDNAADADTYYTQNAGNANVDVATGGMQAIITQKWAALNGIDWFSAYADYRRTGFPIPRILGVSKAPNKVTHNGSVYIPFRYLYPQSEIDRNGANVPAGVTQYTPVFWDTKEK